MKSLTTALIFLIAIVITLTSSVASAATPQSSATIELRGTITEASDADQRRAEEIFAAADAAVYFPSLRKVMWVSRGGAAAFSAGPVRTVSTVREFEEQIEHDFPRFRTDEHGPFIVKQPGRIDRESSRAAASGAATTLGTFSDSFENGLSNWTLGNNTGGSYAWGTTGCEAHSGSHSADAVRGGSADLDCTARYPASVATWMVQKDCSPIKGAQQAWLDAFIHVQASQNGDDAMYFTYEGWGWFYWGTWNAWFHTALNLRMWYGVGDLTKLECTKLEVGFESSAQPAQGIGARVDDLTIGTTTPSSLAASFTATPTSGPAPLTVNFTSTVAGATTATRYNWGFGDPANSTATTPNASFTYTTPGSYWAWLNVSDSSAQSSANVLIQANAPAELSVASFAGGMLQAAGESGATTSYVVTNSGGTDTNVTISQSGDFFTQSPTSFTLAGGASRTVTVTALQKSAGSYEGTATASGTTGSGVQIPIRLVVASPPTAPVVASISGPNRIEVADTADKNPTGTISFTNSGQGTLYGLLTSDVPWLIPQSGAIEIPPGQTRVFTFATDRSRRPDAGSALGGRSGSVTLTFFSGSGFAKGALLEGTTPTSSVSVNIVDVVRPGVAPGTPPALTAGEIALFVPGLSSKSGSIGDVTVWNGSSTAISDLKLFFSPKTGGASPASFALNSVAANSAIAFPGIVKNVFNNANTSGSLQLRSGRVTSVAVAASQVNTTASRSSTAVGLPVIRSDRSAAAGATIYLAGVRKDSASRTDLYVQETSGSGTATVSIDFLDASGSVVSTRAPDSIAPFGLLELTDAVPLNARSARVKNTSATTAAVGAFALLVNSESGDASSIVDNGSATLDTLYFPIPSPPAGSATRELYVVNTSAASATATLTFWPSAAAGRRRASTHSEKTAEVEATNRTLTMAPLQTLSLTDLPNGFGKLSFTAGGVRAAGVFTATSGTSQARAGIPAVPATSAVPVGALKRFAGIEDSSPETIGRHTPSTFRTNLLLFETSGESAKVRVTMYYQFTGSRVSSFEASAREFDLPANGTLKLTDIGTAIIGGARSSYGDLHNAQIDVRVLSGKGTVLPFVESVDNSSGDVTIRE